MKLDDVLKLKEAGFTAEEIATLAPSIKEDVSIVKTDTSAQTKVASPDLTGLTAKIDALTEQMQKLAVQNSSQPGNASTDSLADITAKILGGTK